jgi:pimeloyl-ACP methyl ester carboxylesterase
MRYSTSKTRKSTFREGFVRSRDDVELYYNVQGNGPPIILCSGISVSFLHWKYLVPALCKKYRVIQWNYRGHGESETPTDYTTLTLSHLVEDLERLRSHLRIKKAALLGHSMGTQVILEYYRRYPNKVSALIPALGTYEKLFDSFFDFAPSSQLFKLFYWLAKFRHPGMVASWNLVHLNPFRMNYHLIKALKVIHPKKCSWTDIKPYFKHYKRLEMMTFFELAKSAQEHSAVDILSEIHVPTLVIGGAEDRFTPVELSRTMAKSIPGSEYLEIPDGSHAAFLEEPNLINKHVIQFLDRVRKI